MTSIFACQYALLLINAKSVTAYLHRAAIHLDAIEVVSSFDCAARLVEDYGSNATTLPIGSVGEHSSFNCSNGLSKVLLQHHQISRDSIRHQNFQICGTKKAGTLAIDIGMQCYAPSAL